MKKKLIFLIIFVLIQFIIIGYGQAKDEWEFTIGTGISHSLVSYLNISQKDYPDLILKAIFQTRPLEFPLYYAARIAFWKHNSSWELEVIHLKLYLKNRPAEIQYFAISHGFNLIFINRGYRRNAWHYRMGSGLVLAHPENTIRNRKLPENRGLLRWGYYLSGVTIQLAGGRFILKGKRMGLSLEGKLTAAYAHIPVVNGRARLFNVTFQLILSWHFRISRP